MQDVFRFALLGLGLGALYSLASQGLMVIYRGSGVLNFAHGAIGMVGRLRRTGRCKVEARPAVRGWPGSPACCACAVIGALTHLLVMRQLRRASPLARIVATLGVLIMLQRRAVLRYGARITSVDVRAARRRSSTPFGITISVDRFILVGIAAALSVGAVGALPVHAFGLATTAVAENQRAASRSASRPTGSPRLNWALGSALAGLAAILIAPIVQLQVADDDEPRAGRHGGGAGRRLPLVPDRLRGRHVDRHRPDRARALRPRRPASRARCRSP